MADYIAANKVNLGEVVKTTRDIPQYQILSNTFEDGTHSLKIQSSSGKVYEAEQGRWLWALSGPGIHPDRPGIVAANPDVYSGSGPETLAEVNSLIRAHEGGENFSGNVSGGPKFAQWQLPAARTTARRCGRCRKNMKVALLSLKMLGVIASDFQMVHFLKALAIHLQNGDPSI